MGREEAIQRARALRAEMARRGVQIDPEEVARFIREGRKDSQSTDGDGDEAAFLADVDAFRASLAARSVRATPEEIEAWINEGHD